MKHAWPRPQPLPEPEELIAPRFPPEFLPPPFRDRVGDITERIGVPPDMAAIAMIVLVATAGGRNIRIQPKAVDDWSIGCTAWAVIIAPPASYKTPVVDAIWKVWREFEQSRGEEHQSELSEFRKLEQQANIAKKIWEERCRKAKKASPMPDAATPPAKPKRARLLVTDATLEALVEVLADSDGHLAVMVDELAGFFRRFNQYRSGGDREFYLSLHAGSAYTCDRVSKGTIFLPNPFANIIGGIQPAKLHHFVEGPEGDGDGLQARFSLMIWPASPRGYEYVDRAPDIEAEQKVRERLAAIVELSSTGATLRFSPKAQRIFEAWYTQHRRRVINEQPVMRAHVGKYDGLFGTLCIVHHLMRGKGLGERVDEDTAKSVVNLLEDYLLSHARKIYSYASQTSSYSAAKRIADWLVRERLEVFTRRDVRKHKWAGLADETAIKHALDVLIEKGWIRKKVGTQTGGRPTDKYLVNPNIYGE